MRYPKNRRDSLQVGLSLFMIAGTAAGTLFCNRMDETMKAGLIAMENSMAGTALLPDAEFSELLVRILCERLSRLYLCVLFDLTPIAPFLSLAACACFGFSSAVMVCAMTMDGGAWGIVRYLAVVFPQCLFYIPAFGFLIWHLPGEGKSPGLRAVFLLTIAVAAGAVFECLASPWIASLPL